MQRSLRQVHFMLLLCCGLFLNAQEAYDIQVFSSPTVEKHITDISFHANIAPKGPQYMPQNGHPFHATLEATTGILDNFEIGVYAFTRYTENSYRFMGTHIRPRITVPEKWRWKAGASLSVEFGILREPGSEEFDWDYNIRPIIDKTFGKHYVSLNPSFEGDITTSTFEVTPCFKYEYLLSEKTAFGLEYFSKLGPPLHLDNGNEQAHLLYAVADIELLPEYRLNIGLGHGFTEHSDVWSIKFIIGTDIRWKGNR